MNDLADLSLDDGRISRHGSDMTWSKSLAVSLLATLAGLGLASGVGSEEHGTLLLGLSLPLVCTLLAFAMQWLAFVPAMLARSEHFYDLWGAMTYLTCVAIGVVSSSNLATRGLLVAGLVSVWALRLGGFLFLRVRRLGSDARFDHIKVSGPRFFMAWSLQGLWVSTTLLGVFVVLGSDATSSLGLLDGVGAALWLAGFLIETIADEQKRRFRAESTSGFIASGLWAWSRHPNYFGEILLWSGMAVIASAQMHGWSWLALVSPLFVFGLLRFGSGVPILEMRADRRFGHLASYQAYKRTTPVLVLRPPRS